jgi:hypothetical protein
MTSTTILKPLLACCLLLALSACADQTFAGEPSSSSTSVAPAARPAGAPTQGSCAQVAGGVELCSDHSAPRFALQWTSDGGDSWSVKSFDVPPLLWSPATSLAPGVLAAVGGGDGATLHPFEMGLRSDDLGETWETFELPRFDDQRAYDAGSVVTEDGRLLSLLTEFSDDTLDWEADRYHGLYISDGSDWSAFSPVDPDFTPLLNPAPPGQSALTELSATVGDKQLVRVRTWDDKVYVSTDQGASFTSSS